MASRLQLASGPEIAYSYRPGLPGAPLLVFLNGMMLPAAGWKASIDPLPHTQAYLTYDRPGARDGLSPGLPPDAGAHDILDVVAQLQEVLKTLGINESTPLIVAANSIGCPIARLFASSPTTKHSIKAYLFLDSMVANSDYVSIFPDPTPDENPEVTQTRGLMKRMFHPSVPNGEKLDRRTIPQRLPMSDEPKLPGEPYVTVVGHDSKTFTENGAKLGMVPWVIEEYLEPVWQSYNQGLAALTQPNKSRGPIVAERADHFIQRDRPDLVTEEIERLLQLVGTADRAT